MFQYTTAVDKLRRLTKPIRVIQGGTWAGKTEGIIADYIDRLAESPGMDLTITAESIPALKGGAIKIFQDTMQYTGQWCEDHYNYTDRIYKFNGGGQVQFSSFDSVGKAQAAGKRTDLFINEAQYVPYPIVDALMTRTSGTVTFDFNPNNPFYVHEEILGSEDVEHLILTFEENETTPDKIIRDFDKKKSKAFHNPNGDWNDPNNVRSSYHANWCRVYIRGELGSLEGVIYDNWEIIDEVPTVGLKGYGLDFGFINPSAWIAGYVVDGKRIFDELIYESNLDNQMLGSLMKQRGDINIPTYADSAEPKSIKELKNMGIKVLPADKSSGSVQFGIKLLQEETFYVTSRSLNMIRELRSYSRKTDKNGKYIEEPVKEDDHSMDAKRYLASETMSKTQRRGAQVRIGSYR